MRVPLPNSYQALAERLCTLDLAVSPAEAQGVLCGLICGGDEQAETRWLDEVLGAAAPDDSLAADNRRDWLARAKDTRTAIEEARLGQNLLLPSDEQPLRERASALHAWSQGFLYGLGLASRSGRPLSAETREALTDVVEITRMDLDALEESEENEAALVELIEFLWVAVCLIYEDLARTG